MQESLSGLNVYQMAKYTLKMMFAWVAFQLLMRKNFFEIHEIVYFRWVLKIKLLINTTTMRYLLTVKKIRVIDMNCERRRHEVCFLSG